LLCQACTVLAKQLLQVRKQKARNMNTSSKVMGMGHQMQAMQSTAKMASSMATATKVKVFSGSEICSIPISTGYQNLVLDIDSTNYQTVNSLRSSRFILLKVLRIFE
jgi:hypothetical protein